MSDYRVQVAEARLVLRWAAEVLTDAERFALEALMRGMTLKEAAAQTTVTDGAVWMARQTALAKMRKRLWRLGIESTADLIDRQNFMGRWGHETKTKRDTGAQ